ncbi:hypothetical protein C7B77_04185 [Chamaesiphon polymorphus CCALA 037]|uniref:Uncharacterized protein n=2 Tax=Chamaesiphon TaxID=217161 RepID=A0A2T1GL45_9CYAN|nr:hypothetical protein C7B77_04185 [Chamaesiphon polymorphus CCALA 037]
MVNLIKALKKTVLSFKFKSFIKMTLSLFAVMLLVTTTACGGNPTTAGEKMTSGSGVRPNPANPGPGKVTELYKTIEKPEGGMNNYSDVDPRMDTSEAAAKAERNIKQSGELQKNVTNPFKQLGKQLDERSIPDRVGDGAKGVARSAQQTAEDVAKGTERGYNNLKENTKTFADDLSSGVDELKQNAKNKGDDLKDAANDLKDTIRKAS